MGNPLIYGSICSGIEAATVAWHPLGWTPAFFSEIDAFPRAVLSHHYPDVPLHGDFTTIREGQYAAIDVLVGGTPCQSFSVAGLRAGLDDERGNLALEFCRLARRLRPRWVLWENVPGVLSVDGGRAFASILGGLAECGYHIAYRVLDAQFVRVDGFARAVPQRRRRVFVVGHSGDWRRSAAVLFERESMSGNPAPRREAGKTAAPTLAARTRGGGGLGTDFDCDGGLVANPLLALANSSHDDSKETYVVANEFAATLTRGAESSGKGGYAGRRQEDDVNLVARCVTASQTRLNWGTETFIAFDETQITSATNRSQPQAGDPPHPLAAGARPPTIAFNIYPASGQGSELEASQTEISNAVSFVQNGKSTERGSRVLSNWRIRRLTPTECERLQGFPDGYTAVSHRGKLAADGPRYKALGNSMAVNVMRWIGRRIEMVEQLTEAAG